MEVKCKIVRSGRMRLTTIDPRAISAVTMKLTTLKFWINLNLLRLSLMGAIVVAIFMMPFVLIKQKAVFGEWRSAFVGFFRAMRTPLRTFRALSEEFDIFVDCAPYIVTPQLPVTELPPRTCKAHKRNIVGCVYEEDAIEVLMRYGGQLQTRSEWRKNAINYD